MKDVFDTVSEVPFRAIAAVGSIALLTMGAVWWVLNSSASPSQRVEGTPSSVSVSSVVRKQAETSPPVLSDQQPLEVIVEAGNLLEEAHQASPVGTASLELEDAESRYTVQIGVFTHKNGAQRRIAELEERGYTTRLVSLEESGTASFRLVVGAFPTYNEATVTAKDLKVAGIDAFVRSIE